MNSLCCACQSWLCSRESLGWQWYLFSWSAIYIPVCFLDRKKKHSWVMPLAIWHHLANMGCGAKWQGENGYYFYFYIPTVSLTTQRHAALQQQSLIKTRTQLFVTFEWLEQALLKYWWMHLKEPNKHHLLYYLFYLMFFCIMTSPLCWIRKQKELILVFIEESLRVCKPVVRLSFIFIGWIIARSAQSLTWFYQ